MYFSDIVRVSRVLQIFMSRDMLHLLIRERDTLDWTISDDIEMGRFFLRRYYRFSLNFDICVLDVFHPETKTLHDCSPKAFAFRIKTGDELKDMSLWTHLSRKYALPGA